jgi:hypothetical protein
MYAEDDNNTLLSNRTGFSAALGVDELKLMRSYVGLKGAPSPQEQVFACPADTFYYNYTDRISASHHSQVPFNYSSYAFNAGNSLPGDPPIHPWPGIAGRKINSIKDPVKTVLVLEFPAFLPYSWHQSGGASHYDNARDQVSFVDGRANYIKIYWDPKNLRTGREEA